MNELRSGYIQRHHLEVTITHAIEDAAKKVVNPGENAAYEIGKSLGYTDGLRDALRLIKLLPDDPRPAKPIILGRPDTFPD